MEKFIEAASSDLLADAVPESLKNMLLVMETASIFQENENSSNPLWDLTKEKLNAFLPHLISDLFGDRQIAVTKVEEKRTEPVPVVAENQKKSEEKATEKPIEHEHPAPVQDVNKVMQEDKPQPVEESSTKKDVPEELNVDKNVIEESKPPLSPVDPPVKPPTFFYQEQTTSISATIPPPPKINDLALPPGIEALVSKQNFQQNFQPIQTAPPVCGMVPLVNPKPVMPVLANTASSPLANYFPLPSNVGGGNILTAAFTPTVSPSNTVFMGPGQGDGQGKNESKK